MKLKMKLEVEVTSKEIIKPSTPTRDDLGHYTLSFLDQISPPVYNPLLMFYPTDGQPKTHNRKKYSDLKISLSQVLEYYYPLAGRIKENHLVDCNDDGILYFEAKVSCKLSEVLDNPEPTEMKMLLPFELDEVQEIPLGVQFNVFECGGVCIALCLSHKIADALSTLTFIKTWGAIARGEEHIAHPQFTSASIFPPKNILGYNPSIGIHKENVVTKRFIFNSHSIETLKQKYSATRSSEDQKPPSRIEALSVFIWSRFVASLIDKRNLCLMLHAVNLRSRMDPALPENSFGNFYRFAITIPPEHHEQETFNLISQMRESIGKIDSEYVKKLQKGDEHLDFIKERAEMFMKGEISTLSFTSLCRFPLYEADFGWGKPVWVGSPSLTFKNLIVFMDAASGDGIEALIHLKEEDMVKFQQDEELLHFVKF